METITPDKLNKVEPLQLPQVADNTNYQSLMNDSISMVNNDYNKYLTQQGSVETQQANTGADITNVMRYLEGKTADTITAQEQAGVNTETKNINDITSQLADLNAQASSLNRESQAIPLQIQQQAQGKGLTQAGVAPIQTAQLRDNALKALSVAQQADVAQASLTGSQLRLEQAKTKAQQIIDVKYAPQEAKLKTLQAQYIANKDYLDRVDKKLSQAYETKLKLQSEQMQYAKENEKGIADIIVTAQGNQAPAGLIALASKATSKLEAATILGKYSGDYLKNELLKAQIAKEYASAAKDRVAGAGAGFTISKASPEAQNWLKLINAGTISLEDAMTKIGSSKQGLALKNEITTLLAESGSKTQPQIGQLKNVVDSLNTLLKGDVEYFGFSIAPRWESNPYYMTFKTQLENTIALLTGDNLGLLKGPMSDKDIEFIRNMSAGINENMDEKTAKARLEQIKARIESKIPTNQSGNDRDSYLDSVEKSLNDVDSASYQPPINMYANSFTR